MRRKSWFHIAPISVLLGACTAHEDPEGVYPSEEAPAGQTPYTVVPEAKPLQPEPAVELADVPVRAEPEPERVEIRPVTRMGPRWIKKQRPASQRVKVRKSARHEQVAQ